MEYQQYQPPRHAQPPMGSGYTTSPTGGPSGVNMSSPRQSAQQTQASPVLPSQTSQYPPQASAGYPPHQMAYPQQQAYGMQPPMTYQPQNMSTTQAAAMATAAATGTAYYPMPRQGYNESPRGVQVKTERRGPTISPRQAQMSMPQMHQQSMQGQMQPGHQMPAQRQMVVNNSPGMPAQQPMMNHTAPRASVPPAPAPQQQSPEAMPVAGGAEESPLYVNAKQFHRILKRRVARQRLEEQLRLTSKTRKPYLHESRHNHAMRRPRGPGGRFLTADEVAALEKKEAEEGGGGGGEHYENGDVNGEDPTPSPGSKRKAIDDTDELGVKKSRMGSPDGEEAEAEAEEDDEADEDDEG